MDGLLIGLLLASAIFVALIALLIIGERFWWPLERRRQAAARRDGVHTFSVIEPLTSALQLPIPSIINMRVKRRTKLIVWACYLCYVLIMIGLAGALLLGYGSVDYGFLVQVTLTFAAFGVGVTFLTQDWRIEASESGVTVRAAGFKQAVPWDEASLFAITRGKGPTLRYELASPTASAEWMWVRPGTFSARLFEPTIPQYEYDLQMEALLALVATKTGLPLYDLR